MSSAVDAARLQFAITALYHFLFVPLTLGLAPILGIMESVYIMTRKDVWKRATHFWGKLFAVNFAMGVATGITLEFQFGTNWAYYSHYVGDIFGVPLAVEGMMAFFLESTFVGLMIFGWEKLSRVEHLAVTWLTAIGAQLSALWILIANGWMQNPVGAHFNPDTMRMELTSLWDVFFNDVAQAKFVHTVSAGYVTGAMFVLAVSAYYLLRGREQELARRSMVVAASFGLASALCVVVLGDESGYTATINQKMKIAAIESMWETEPAPASFTVIGLPDSKEQTTHYALKVPYLLGIIATRSLDTPVPGIKPLVEVAAKKIRDGLVAYDALTYLRMKDKNDKKQRAALDAHVQNLGYALLLKRFVDDPRKATAAQIQQAAESTIPNVWVLFFSFRIMVGLGLYFILLFGSAFWLINIHRRFGSRRFLWLCVLSLPLPWVAAEFGWIVAEHGRQPWAIEGVLPTFLGVSSVSAGDVWTSLAAFILFYSALLAIELYLMVKLIRKGPTQEVTA